MNKRIIPVVITPFTEQGDISKDGLDQLYSYLKNYGIKTMFVGGSYASFAIMPSKMRVDLAFESTEIAKHYDLKSIFNIASSSPEESISLINHIENSGVENLATLVPYYYSSSNFYKYEIISKYLSMMVSSTKLPLYFYNNPKTTGVDLSPAELNKLSETGIVGIKDSNENMNKLLEITSYPIGKTDAKVKYIPGTTASMLIAASLGLEYCMSGLFMSFPTLIGDLFCAAAEGNIRLALEKYKTCMKARDIMGHFAPRAVSAYYILRLRGVNVGEPKFPWPRLDKQQQKSLKDMLKEINAL
ncbi:MAG: dihydrodipicolinate synthase family protein [Nitrospinae bacterium]|nr:dihydrodipicolinate synthase family protein [Nitrospinota bacterium]